MVWNVSDFASVYLVSMGRAEHGTSFQLKQLYEHNLQRAAFNFCYGPFGGVQGADFYYKTCVMYHYWILIKTERMSWIFEGRDFICVQSMDGTVSVFEQESFAFSRFLPGALLPGPIKYVPKMDSFVTVSSQRCVESYKCVFSNTELPIWLVRQCFVCLLITALYWPDTKC